MHFCSFEFVAANESVVRAVMEDLPLMQNHRYNLSLSSPHWEASPSINTYYALDSHLIDSYFRLHRRRQERSVGPSWALGVTGSGSCLVSSCSTCSSPSVPTA